MRIKNALVYTVEHGFEERDVRIKNGCFAGSEAAGTDGEEILDAGGDYLIPGLVDIHFHGCAGHDFSDGTPEALQAIGAYELRQGVTSICPASMTLSEETLKTVCANAYAYTKRPEAEQDTGARLIGIHLEGPFISMEKKGAQNPAYIRNPDVGDVPAAAGGSTRAGASDYDCTGDGRCQGVHPPAGGSGTYLGRTYLQ